MSEALNIYVVYNKPKDFPDEYVVRRWVVNSDGTGMPNRNIMLKSRNIDAIRDSLNAVGLHRIQRFVNDDPVILETWV